VLPAWASDRIDREVSAYLARGGSPGDADLTRVATLLQAWPVYGDLGGVLPLAADGTVFYRCNDTMRVRLEPDPGWRLLAWAAAAAAVPELRHFLPTRPTEVPDCLSCGGTGQVAFTPDFWFWCGECCGTGWRQ
jgi:hypothetical protein